MGIQPKVRFLFKEPDYIGWHFWVYIDKEYFDFINGMEYVTGIMEFSNNDTVIVVDIDRRYDLDEAWLDLYDQLQLECQLREAMAGIP